MLAEKYNIVKGKWMMFVERTKIKDLWKRLAEKVSGNVYVNLE